MSETNKRTFSIDTSRLDNLAILGATRLNDAQKEAVLARGRVMVSAAAGSGKTFAMVNRIMLHIAEGGTLRRMLVLVYNNAAADEIKERLHQSLFEAACNSADEARERFRDELDALEFAHIGTIHGFCQSLIRENFDKLGISPTFEVLDEPSHRAYMQQALDNVLSSYAEQQDAVFDDVMEIFSRARKEDNLRDNIVRLYTMLDIQPDKSVFLDKVRACFSSFEDSAFFDVPYSSARTLFSQVSKRIGDLILRLTPYNQKYVCNLASAQGICEAMLGCTTFFDMLKIAQAGYDKQGAKRSNKANDEEILLIDMAKSYISAVDGMLEDILCYSDLDFLRQAHAQNAVYIDKIMEIVIAFGDELSRLKAADNVLSFEDLQHKAAELIRIVPEVARGFESVFVDEYQDVNPTQEFIINGVLGENSFMVGDVKQSVYGFRLADPTIFLARQKRYEQGEGRAISFNTNFRSGRGILAFVNGVFDAIMTKQSADVDYKNTARFELDNALDGGSVQLHLFTEDKKGRVGTQGLYDITTHEMQDEVICAAENEGRYIANEIRSLVGRAKGDGKYISYGDIAVLFRSRNTSAQAIVDVLRAENIPLDEGGFSKTNSLPEREIVLMLRVLDNPRQDIPLAGYLLSFFGGYNEQDLANIAACEGESLYDKLLVCADDEKSSLSSRLKTTLAALDMYRIKASFKNVSELVSSIISDYSYDAYLMRLGEADVSALRTFTLSDAAKNATSIGRFLRGYVGGESAAKAGMGGDRVHIATFHGYKGLESPAVFIADAAGAFSNKSRIGDIVAADSGYIGLSYFDFDKKSKSSTLSKMATARLIRERETKEEMRLFYVALTRAKQYMYITASVSDTKNAAFGKTVRLEPAGCNLDFISNAICDGCVSVSVFRHTGEERIIDEFHALQRPIISGGDRVLGEEIAKAREFVYPHKESTGLAMKYSVSTLDSIDDDTVRVFDERASIGTAYHKVMQHIDYFAQDASAVEAEIERMLNEGLISPQERAAIITNDIVRCLESELMQLARESEKSGHCYRERAFMMYKPANEVSDKFASNDKVLVQGVVDLIIDGEKKIIVDFKNSYLKDAQTLEKYKKQLYLYKTAVEGVIGAKIDKTLLYSFKTGKTLEL